MRHSRETREEKTPYHLYAVHFKGTLLGSGLTLFYQGLIFTGSGYPYYQGHPANSQSLAYGHLKTFVGTTIGKALGYYWWVRRQHDRCRNDEDVSFRRLHSKILLTCCCYFQKCQSNTLYQTKDRYR